MPHFVNRRRRYFLSTNYKVLYSLLVAQPTLQVADPNRVALHGLLKPWLPVPWMGHFLLVRDPYQRLESFYKDKFCQEPTRALRPYAELQHSHRCFGPYLRIDVADAPATIREKLLGLSFAQFIRLLPNVYLLDGHLYPQVNITTLLWCGRSHQLAFDRIFKVESATDLAYLQDGLALDLSQSYNSTQSIALPDPWQPELRTIVNHLYKADFAAFRYEMYTT